MWFNCSCTNFDWLYFLQWTRSDDVNWSKRSFEELVGLINKCWIVTSGKHQIAENLNFKYICFGVGFKWIFYGFGKLSNIHIRHSNPVAWNSLLSFALIATWCSLSSSEIGLDIWNFSNFPEGCQDSWNVINSLTVNANAEIKRHCNFGRFLTKYNKSSALMFPSGYRTNIVRLAFCKMKSRHIKSDASTR